MKDNLFKYKTKVLIFFIIFGALFRFYNLNWGAPYYFHPDERNIASSVSQLKFPNQLNPNFFAYGSLPIYSIFTIGLLKNLILHCLPSIQICLPTAYESLNFVNYPSWQNINHLKFEDSVLISRLFSAIFSSLLILVIYYAGRILHSIQAGLLAAFFSTSSVGLIQFAHFGTFEMWLTFFSILLFILSLKILNQYRILYVLLSAITLGILVSAKISHIVLLPLPIISIVLSLYKEGRAYEQLENKIQFFLEAIAQISAIIVITVIIYILSNPYVVLDFSAFRNSMNYESNVALGSIAVFYTHEFFDTIPIIYHFLKVYPFLLNPLVTILFIPSLLYVIYIGIKTKNIQFFFLTAYFLFLFLSQAFLFVKWTRYMVPTLPFIYLITTIAFVDLLKFFKYKITNKTLYEYTNIFVSGSIICVCVIFSLAYYKTVLVKPDSRITAVEWAEKNMQKNSNVLSESYDIGIVAFNSHFAQIASCDMYYLENNQHPCNGFTLNDTLEDAEYIILPSERVLKMSILNNQRFPQRNKFYRSLIFNKSNYKLIYKTPCDIYCKILYLGDTLYSFEQTAHVFDRPTVYIFEKFK